MGGGLMQLVAYGAQDIYLTGNPQITFFKVVYRRHTNFAMESIEQTFNGAAKMGQKFSCTIARNGDLLSQVYLEMDVKLNKTHNIQSVTLDDGGTTPISETLDSTSGMNIEAYSGVDNVITLTGFTTEKVAIVPNFYGNSDIYTRLGEVSDNKLTEINGSKRIAQRMINSVEVEIGGQSIDKHYGDWMDIWAGLTYSNEQYTKWDTLVNAKVSSNSGNQKVYVPLQFWFCRNPGLALPLIALQYHEVKINVEFNSSISYTTGNQDFIRGDDSNSFFYLVSINDPDAPDGFFDTTANTDVFQHGITSALPHTNVSIKTTVTVTPSIENCCVFCDYIFLDTDERRRFAQVSHEYLIEQVQYSNALTLASGDDQHELRFNHPVKEIVWAAQTGTNAGNNFNYFNGTGDMINTALLQLNGHDRMKKREGSYFRCVQPYQHHTGADGQSNTDEWGGYYCYSFGLKPEEHQPSGTCNFSRIDNAVLIINGAPGTLKVWAINYNVLRIMSGMGGLAYSN